MGRILLVWVVCASCSGVESQATGSATRAAEAPFAALESCYVVKDDLGAVGFFATFEPGTSRIPERLDSIRFLAENETAPVLTWDGGADLKPFDAPAGPGEPRRRYATNARAVHWGEDPDRWPRTVVVSVEGRSFDSCELGELVADDVSRPLRLGAPNGFGEDQFGYGNCPHCVASFLCGCLGLEDELDYCDPAPSPETLQNCPDVVEYLFPPPLP